MAERNLPIPVLFKKVKGREKALIQKQRLFDFLGGGRGRLLDRERLFEEIGYLVKPSTKKLKRIKLMSQSIDYHAVKLDRYFINLRKQPTCQTVYPSLDQATLKKIDKFCYPQNIRKSKIKNQN